MEKHILIQNFRNLSYALSAEQQLCEELIVQDLVLVV